jgi:hypothetical protein
MAILSFFIFSRPVAFDYFIKLIYTAFVPFKPKGGEIMAGEGKKSKVNVLILLEDVLNNKPARIDVYENDELTFVITATVEQQQGADGRFYPAVSLKKIYP